MFKKLACMLLCCVYVEAANSITTLTFRDNTAALPSFPSLVSSSGPYVAPFTKTADTVENSEFRMISPGGSVGGASGVRSVIDPEPNLLPVEWVFDANDDLSDVNNTPPTGGSLIPGSAAPSGGTGLHLGSTFFSADFNFLAPTVTSAAGLLYGNGTVIVDVYGESIRVFMPVLEAQWGDVGNEMHFPLGLQDDFIHGTGITFNGQLENVTYDTPSSGLATFGFVITAEHIIQPLEDNTPVSFPTNFTLWTPQWELHGAGVSPMATLNSPTVNDGVLSATNSGTLFNNGRITESELLASLIPADEPLVVTDMCIGTCWDFTVSSISGTFTQVELPLSFSIPPNAIYRHYINNQWRNFNVSGNDVIQSAPGVLGDCSPAGPPQTFTPGLKEGDFCIRLTIMDGGVNDVDLTTDGNVVHTGGVAVPYFQAPSSPSITTGCSINMLLDLSELRFDKLLILSVFILWLGCYMRRIFK